MDFHPIAAIFPLLEGDELDALANDIREHGVKEPVLLFEGKILDGRNRHTACVMAGKMPEYIEFMGSHGDAISHVWSVNRRRRQLNSSQAAVAEVKRARISQEYADVVAAMAANSAERRNRKPAFVRELIPEQTESGRTRDIRAKAAGTNRKYIDDAEKLFDSRPDLIDDIERGVKTLTQVKRELKDEQRAAKRKEAAEQIAAAPTISEAIAAAKFSTICIDPPWDWGDEGDNSQLGRGDTTYGSISISDLHELPIGDKADADAHIYLWITNRSLPKGFSLLESWGFRYITCLTWCKPSFGMGNYFRGSTEQILFGVRGSLPLNRKDVGTWFEAARGPDGHSSKPIEFYELVERCSPGPYLDVFSRRERDRWTCWGGQL